MAIDPVQRAIEEYKLCESKAARLEDYIWKTAGLFSLGSGVGIVAIARHVGARPREALLTTFVASILGSCLTLVWWRFALRWWTIIHRMIRRMEELEAVTKFKMTTIVSETDKHMQAHWHYLKDHGNPIERVYAYYLELDGKKTDQENILERSGEKWNPAKVRAYEFRGMVESSRFLVIVMISLWLFILSYSLIGTFHTLNWLKSLLLFSVTCPFIVFFLFLVAFLWRRR